MNEFKEDQDQTRQPKSASPGMGILHALAEWISKVDTRAVTRRVAELRAEMPQAGEEQLIEELIKRKCQHTARVGAATAATGTIPILGTFFSLTVGMMIDLGAVITAQAELVLEIAEVRGISLSKVQRRETVFVVLGLGASLEHLGSMASQRLMHKLAKRFSRRWLSHVLPLVGIATAAGLNAFSTYLIGQRAKAYFSQGAEAMGDWKHSLRALSGLDERKLMQWLREQGSVISSANLGKLFDEAKSLGEQTLGKVRQGEFGFKKGKIFDQSEKTPEADQKTDQNTQQQTEQQTRQETAQEKASSSGNKSE